MKTLALILTVVAIAVADKLPHDGGAAHGGTHGAPHEGTSHTAVHHEGGGHSSSYSAPPAETYDAPQPAPPPATYSAGAPPPATYSAGAPPQPGYDQQGYYYYYYPVENQKSEGYYGNDLAPIGNIVIVGLVVVGVVVLLVALLSIETNTFRSFDWMPELPSFDVPYEDLMEVGQKVFKALQKEY